MGISSMQIAMPVLQMLATTVLCASLTAPVCALESADRIWTGGPILTLNDKAMRAQAVARPAMPACCLAPTDAKY